MADPMPTLTGEEIANLKILLNGQASAIDFRLQQTIDEDHAADSVPTVEDLPLTGNWPGRITLVVDVDQLYVCTSLPSTWVRLNYLDRATTTPTLGAGWTNVDHNTLIRRGGFAYLQFNAVRTSDLGSYGVVLEIPPGYRGELHCWTSGWDVIVTSNTFQVFYDPTDHKVKIGFAETIPSGASLAVSMSWPIL